MLPINQLVSTGTLIVLFSRYYFGEVSVAHTISKWRLMVWDRYYDGVLVKQTTNWCIAPVNPLMGCSRILVKINRR